MRLRHNKKTPEAKHAEIDYRHGTAMTAHFQPPGDSYLS